MHQHLLKSFGVFDVGLWCAACFFVAQVHPASAVEIERVRAAILLESDHAEALLFGGDEDAALDGWELVDLVTL